MMEHRLTPARAATAHRSLLLSLFLACGPNSWTPLDPGSGGDSASKSLLSLFLTSFPHHERRLTPVRSLVPENPLEQSTAAVYLVGAFVYGAFYRAEPLVVKDRSLVL